MRSKLDKLLDEAQQWCAQGRGRQSLLARHLGVPRQAVYHWLKRKQRIPAATALELQEFMRHRKPPKNPDEAPLEEQKLAT